MEARRFQVGLWCCSSDQWLIERETGEGHYSSLWEKKMVTERRFRSEPKMQKSEDKGANSHQNFSSPEPKMQKNVAADFWPERNLEMVVATIERDWVMVTVSIGRDEGRWRLEFDDGDDYQGGRKMGGEEEISCSVEKGIGRRWSHRMGRKIWFLDDQLPSIK